MKKTVKIFALAFLLINCSCKAQMAQTTKDVYLLKTNEQQFINKPLKDLLKEIKPEIKVGYGTIGEGHQYFSFKFRTLKDWGKNQGNWEDRVTIYVYVKEPIDWQSKNRPKGKEMIWTKEDAAKYGNLTVGLIKVYIQPKE